MSSGVHDDAVLTRLDNAAARRWAVVTRAAFASRRAEIDALNVFPVPDGDTGTNLYLTFDAGLDAARTEYEERSRAGRPVAEHDLATESEIFARALLLTARGNSGVILSQIFRGFADEAAARGESGLGGQGLSAAIGRADDLAWSSVSRPVEGTILSVSRAAATAAAQAAKAAGAATGIPADESLYAVTFAALAAARTALARTPQQLPRLAQAGVVDAGGAGYVLLLESLERVVTGDLAAESFVGEDPLKRRAGWTQPAANPFGQTLADLEEGGPAYEVMFLLSGSSDAAVDHLRQRLDHLGDSVLVVGSGDLRNVHVHVDDVGAAIEAGMAAGRPHRIRVTHFRDQVRATPDRNALAVVTCAAGEGLAVAFRAAGAWVIPSGPRRRASAGQFLDAVRSTGAASVLLLPNDADTLLAANAAARVGAEEGIEIQVVPARTAVQGIAALAVHDPGRSLAENVLAMSSAAAATRNGAVTVATKEAFTSGGLCHAGDVLGIVDGDIVIVDHESDEHDGLAGVAGQVVDRLLASGGELLTIVAGEDASPSLAAQVGATARTTRRHLEVNQLYGGQPVYPLLLGVE